MAFRVFPFPYASVLADDAFASAPCEIVGEHDPYDAVFFWINPDAINDFRSPVSLMWLGYMIGTYQGHIWVAVPPKFRDEGIAVALKTWNGVGIVFNSDPCDALCTLIRKHFIGLPYAEYLLTPHWQEVREVALKTADNRCQICYSPVNVQVHHRTYDRRGHELPSDVTVLCAACHGRFHDKLPKE
jgi:5-methylcytosine-specific restriction endonuclease McrA